MENNHELRFAVASTDIEALDQLARKRRGTLYADNRADPSKLPFAGLATLVSDDLDQLQAAADVGLYVVCQRTIKPGSAEVYGLFPLIHHPDITHNQADAHWRDNHGPLALEHHKYMSHYVQLSVVQKLHGPDIDGFALCGFNTLEDFKHKFFSTEASVQVIADDIENFADTKNSPRRLIATPSQY